MNLMISESDRTAIYMLNGALQVDALRREF